MSQPTSFNSTTSPNCATAFPTASSAPTRTEANSNAPVRIPSSSPIVPEQRAVTTAKEFTTRLPILSPPTSSFPEHFFVVFFALMTQAALFHRKVCQRVSAGRPTMFGVGFLFLLWPSQNREPIRREDALITHTHTPANFSSDNFHHPDAIVRCTRVDTIPLDWKRKY